VITSDKARTGTRCSFSLCSTCLFLLILKNSTSLCLLPFFVPRLSPDASWAVFLDFLSGMARENEVRQEVRHDACWWSWTSYTGACLWVGMKQGRHPSDPSVGKRPFPCRASAYQTDRRPCATHLVSIAGLRVNGTGETRRREHLLQLLQLLRDLNAFRFCKRDH
jgi:hypothetical protein